MRSLSFIYYLIASVAHADIHTVNIQPVGERYVYISLDNCIDCYAWWMVSNEDSNGHISGRPTLGKSKLIPDVKTVCGPGYKLKINVREGFHSIRLKICNRFGRKHVCDIYKNYSLPENNCDKKEQYMVGE